MNVVSSSVVSSPEHLALLELCQSAIGNGPQWAHASEDLNVTLLSWEQGKRIEAHTNNEVDNILIGLSGEGIVTIDGQDHLLHTGVFLLIPKGCERAVQSTSPRCCYLSIHRRRGGLMPTFNEKTR